MKRIVHTTWAPKAVGPYSQAVEINGTLYISGQIPMDPETGEIVKGGIREQTKRVLENIRVILNAAGYSPQDVVKSTCLLSDMKNFQVMNEVYESFYPVDPPARAAFQVAKLPLDVMIEIETIAVKQHG